MITDLTAVLAGHGPARLLDMVPGRSAAAMTDWLEARSQAFRDQVEIVADGRVRRLQDRGRHSVAGRRHGDGPVPRRRPGRRKLDLCRQRIQQDTLGHRGRCEDPLYRVRRTLRTRLGLLTDKQKTRLEALFAADEHVAVEVTWWAYQQIIAAYADDNRARGKTLLTAVIDRLRTGLPAGLDELATLGRTLHRRRDDILAYFGPPRFERTD